MSSDEIRRVFLSLLARAAPGEDPTTVPPAAGFREALEIDSMDYLHLLTLVAERFDVEVPEADYPSFQTIDDAVAYLAARLPSSEGPW